MHTQRSLDLPVKVFDEALATASFIVRSNRSLDELNRREIYKELTIRIRALIEQGQLDTIILVNEAVAHLRQVAQKRRSLHNVLGSYPNVDVLTLN